MKFFLVSILFLLFFVAAGAQTYPDDTKMNVIENGRFLYRSIQEVIDDSEVVQFGDTVTTIATKAELADGVEFSDTLTLIATKADLAGGLGSQWTTVGSDITYSGNVGINQPTPLYPIHVGDNGIGASADPQIVIDRRVDDTGSGNAHAFVDASSIQRSGTIGYNSFDARGSYAGTNNFDHYAGFQSAFNYNSSGTMTNLYNFYAVPVISQSTVTNSYGLYVANKSGAGVVTNQYGVYIPSLTGGTNNYAFYSAGATPNVFLGNTSIGSATPESTEKLDVYGPVRFRTIDGSGNSVSGAIIHRKASIAVGDKTYLDFQIGAGASPFSFARIGASILNANDGRLHFQTRTDSGGPQDRMIIDHNGEITILGSVTYTNATAPASVANAGSIWSKDVVAGQAHLFAKGETGVEEQITGLSRVLKTNQDYTTTTYTAVSDLTFNVEAGKTYLIDAIIFVDIIPEGGLKITLDGTATTTLYAVGTHGDIFNPAMALGDNLEEVAGTTSDGFVSEFRGSVIINAAGTLGIQGAQFDAGGGTTTVLAGSYLKLAPSTN